LDPTVGHEIKKTRPALIMQNNVSNQYSPITIVAAISSQFSDPPHPREVLIHPGKSGLRKPSAAILNQIRSVDRKRLIQRLGRTRRANNGKHQSRIDDQSGSNRGVAATRTA